MPSPFPGMDPYLERPRWFRGLHGGLIFCLQDALQPLLPAPYFAMFGELVWLETSERYVEPDVDVLISSSRRRDSSGVSEEGGVATIVEVEEEVEKPVVIDVSRTADEEQTQPYIEIYTRREGEDRLVTSIEVLSITNKTLRTPGRQKYLEKQSEILDGQVHLVEIDLLRGGAHTTAVPLELAREKAGLFDYHVSIRRFDRPRQFLLYPIPLEKKLPTIMIPLLPGDPDVPLNLQAIFQRVYDAGPYRRVIVYGVDPVDPPLTTRQQAWAEEILRKQAETKSRT
jgi:hypothetical protein